MTIKDTWTKPRVETKQREGAGFDWGGVRVVGSKCRQL